MNLYLIVYYVDSIEQSKYFFELLGLSFTKEKHGDGPVHFSTTLSKTVLELYPNNERNGITRTRLGLELPTPILPDIKAIENLSDKPVDIMSLDNDKKYAVLEDPNGNKIDLVWQSLL